MNIRVKETKNLDGSIVTKGKLVLIGNKEIFHLLNHADFRLGNIKPIIISETEEINVGDKFLSKRNEIVTCIRKDQYGTPVISNTTLTGSYEEFPTIGFKILALPEHLSPEILQMIVNGDLIDGQDLWVECKKVCIGDTDMKGGCLCSSRHCEELATIIKLIYNHINIFPIQQNPQLQKALDIYIKEKHTQEECIGFIDGFEKAMELLKI